MRWAGQEVSDEASGSASGLATGAEDGTGKADGQRAGTSDAGIAEARSGAAAVVVGRTAGAPDGSATEEGDTRVPVRSTLHDRTVEFSSAPLFEHDMLPSHISRRNALLQLLGKSPASRTEADLQVLISYIKRLRYFRGVDDFVKMQLCRSMVGISARAGEIIYRRGGTGHLFFIIVEGRIDQLVPPPEEVDGSTLLASAAAPGGRGGGRNTGYSSSSSSSSSSGSSSSSSSSSSDSIDSSGGGGDGIGSAVGQAAASVPDGAATTAAGPLPTVEDFAHAECAQTEAQQSMTALLNGLPPQTIATWQSPIGAAKRSLESSAKRRASNKAALSGAAAGPTASAGETDDGSHLRGQVLKHLHRGDGFGELALDARVVRRPDGVVLEDSMLIAVHRDVYAAALEEASSRDFANNRRFLGSLSLFTNFPGHELSDLARVVKPMRFGCDEVVLAQGAPPDGLYIVRKGKCCVVKDAAVRDRLIDAVAAKVPPGADPTKDREYREAVRNTSTKRRSSFLAERRFSLLGGVSHLAAGDEAAGAQAAGAQAAGAGSTPDRRAAERGSSARGRRRLVGAGKRGGAGRRAQASARQGQQPEPLELGTMGPREYFGEVAVLGDANQVGSDGDVKQATASVISMTSVEVLLLRKADLFQNTSYGTRELMRHNTKSGATENTPNDLVMNSEAGAAKVLSWRQFRARVIDSHVNGNLR